jgi:predicted nucleic acid-binding protein
LRKGDEIATRRLLDTFSWQDITVGVADRAGELAQRYRKSHRGIDFVDYLISAATLELDGTLLTANVKHFPMFPGLKAPY